MVENAVGKMIEHYRLIKPLGDGQFGVGFLAADTSADDNMVCVKLFKEMDEATEDTFRAEVAAGQAGIFHEHVLRLLGAGKSVVTKDGEPSGEEMFYIVSELAENGESFDYVQMAEGLDPKYARQLFKQIVEAVSFVHSKGIAHRDLKLENLFLDKNVSVKLADFGLMKAFAGPNGDTLMTQCGTDNYMAPELSGEQKAYAGPPVDIFAMGAMLFLMCYGRFAFSDCSDVHYRRLIKNPALALKQKKLEAEPELLDLIVGMLQPEVDKRYTMEQIKEHSWFAGETASSSDMKTHYDGLKALNLLDTAAKQAALAQYAGSGEVERCHAGDIVTASKEDVETWSQLEYKEFAGANGSKMAGFYTESFGQLVFQALYQFVATEYKEIPVVSTNSFKMKFTITEEGEKAEACEGFEDLVDDSPSAESCDVQVSITSVVEGEDGPESMYVDFQRKSGSGVVFGKFYKNALKEGKLNMFISEAPQE